MGDRFARLYHGYDGEAHCSSFSNNDNKPEACFLGGADAQAAASVANLVNNSLTFITASLTGSLSDEYGRKGKFVVISQLFFRFWMASFCSSVSHTIRNLHNDAFQNRFSTFRVDHVLGAILLFIPLAANSQLNSAGGNEYGTDCNILYACRSFSTLTRFSDTPCISIE